MTARALALVLVTSLAAATPVAAQTVYQSPDWYIDLSDPGDSSCAAAGATEDRVTIETTLSDCRSSVFALARRAGLQFDYGTGSSGAPRYAAGSGCP